jgi:cytochrome c biogenesis protein CcdA/thiol-disulfide isomerase/thioredoxin
MITLIVVGFLAGVITSISPCVLPVLPVVLTAGSARRETTVTQDPDSAATTTARADSAGLEGTVLDSAGSAGSDDSGSDGTGGTGLAVADPATDERPRRVRSWRPYGIVAGLVLSFSLSTLFGSLVLSALHLPQDLLRDAGIVVLVLIGIGLIWVRFGDLLERPFARLRGRQVNPDSNGIVIGLGLGLLFVPCAGPVLATIAVVGATHEVGFGAIVLTVAFGVGVGVPLLVLAIAGDAVARRTGILRRRAKAIRVTGGVVMILVAAAIGFNLTDGLQRDLPGYTTALQNSVEQNSDAAGQLHQLTKSGNSTAPGTAGANGSDNTCTADNPSLVNCGQAPELAGITSWLNTPGDKPLTLAGLRGKVVLIDFWTYSCINCQRTLPHVEAWYKAYQQDGLVVIGVHTPEFAFEHVTSNVAAQSKSLGVQYPVAIDNDYGTWNAYGNQYWPAEYLIDATGTIRHVSFGEGEYASTEELIRELLGGVSGGSQLPAPTDIADTTPTEQQTPETYLGHQYAPLHVTGAAPTPDTAKAYQFPSALQPDTFALSGTWNDGDEALTAGAGAQLELSYQAKEVYLVIGGTGTVTVRVDGKVTKTESVAGVPKLYTLASGTGRQRSTMTLSASPGVQAYDFTFG